jgi:hypothetical protein
LASQHQPNIFQTILFLYLEEVNTVYEQIVESI